MPLAVELINMSQNIDLEGGDNTTPGQLTGNQQSIDRLKVFRNLVGITPLPVPGKKEPKRPAENKGTYKRLCESEAKARVEYYATATAINTCLLAQIVVAAALTALGASDGSHIVITVLGSINTIIAGIMTYLKGQGLPTRLLEYANGLRKVREYIEEVERQFMRPDTKLDLDAEVKKCIDMYEAVRQNAEDNDPNAIKPLGPSSPKDALIGSKPRRNYQSISSEDLEHQGDQPTTAPATATGAGGASGAGEAGEAGGPAPSDPVNHEEGGGGGGGVAAGGGDSSGSVTNQN